MYNKIIPSLEISHTMFLTLKTKVKNLKLQYNLIPSLATILVGDNPSSLIYIRAKIKKLAALGMQDNSYILKVETTEAELLNLIQKLNHIKNIHGILLQMPLPKHINSLRVIDAINPNKDVDGLHPLNMGYLDINNPIGFTPCTPLGCLHLIKSVESHLSTKQAVVIGRSHLVGFPMFKLLNNEDCTVTLAHAKTKNLTKISSQADILVVAIGSSKFIKKEFIKTGAIVIDVGINRVLQDNKSILTGDVDLVDILPKVMAITKVPQGVGLMTINYLMYNTYKACLIQNNLPLDC